MSAVQGKGELPVPEEMEIETQDIDETVYEAIERESSWLLKAIALSTALLARLAAVAALKAGARLDPSRSLIPYQNKIIYLQQFSRQAPVPFD